MTKSSTFIEERLRQEGISEETIKKFLRLVKPQFDTIINSIEEVEK